MESPAVPPYERMILVCCNDRVTGEASCGPRGGAEHFKALKAEVKARGLAGRIRVTKSMCLGPCEKGPNVCIQPENLWYHGVAAADLPAILDAHAPKSANPPADPASKLP